MSKKARKIITWIMLLLMIGSVVAGTLIYTLM